MKRRHRAPGRATAQIRGHQFAVPGARDVVNRLWSWGTDPMFLIVGLFVAYLFAVLSVGARMAP